MQELSILHLEDNVQDRELVRTELERLGFALRVAYVETKPDFERALQQSKFDLILSDFSMPDYAGEEALRRAKQQQPETPFIFVSGTIREDRALDALKAGAADYVLKAQLPRLAPIVLRALREHAERAKRLSAQEELRASQERLRETDERYRAVFNRALDGVYLHDFDGRFIDANPAALSLLGYDASELPALTIASVLHPDDLERARGAMRRLLSTGVQDGVSEYRLRRKDGGLLWVEVLSSIVFKDDVPFAIQGFARDITARKRAEDALRSSEERFRAIVANEPECVKMVGADGRILEMNAAGLRILQADRADEVLGRPAIEFVHPEDRAALAAMHEVVREGRNATLRFRTVGLKGAVRWVEDHSTGIRDPVTNEMWVLSVVRDITEHLQAEVKLREQAALLEQAREAIIVRDLDQRIRYWNRAAEGLYGWPAEAVIGVPAGEVGFEDVATAARALENVMAAGEWSGEMAQTSRSGASVLVEARWTLVRDDAGAPRSILAINHDITERKRVEAQALRNQRLESLGTLAGGIAHDLNNMLAPIIMGVGLLQANTTDPKDRKLIDIIEASAQRGSDLVRQILSFARGVDGARLAIDVAQIVREIEYVVASTFPKNIAFAGTVPPDTWQVSGDPTQLNQVLLNLCVNARDAMPRGGKLSIVVQNTEIDAQFAVLHRGVSPGRFVVIDVIDTGVGMTKEVAARVFEPFFTTKPRGAGTGLGLSTALGIVQSHQGFVDLQTALGRGTTIRVYLPALDGGRPGTHETGTPQALPRGRGELVIVVDDEATVLQITRQTLESFGYRVLAAEDGAHAIGLFAQQLHEVSVVLTDMMMPIMDGAALIAALRRLRPDLPIIAASGVPVSDAALAGSIHLLAKPYTAEALLSLLRKILEPLPR